MAIDREEFSPVIREFADYKLIVQGRSALTMENYLFDLRMFLRFIKLRRAGAAVTEEAMETCDVRDVDLDVLAAVKTGDIYEFLSYALKERANDSAARARKLSAVKGLYKYLTTRVHKLEVNPAADIESPSMKRQLPKYLSVEESVALLSAVQADTESKTRARDYAILTLFLNCGMRLSELCGISFGDMDPELRSLRVLGKGAKERIVYLNDACREALEAYLPVRRAQKAKKGEEQALFLSGQSRRISDKTVQWMVKRYLEAAGLGYKHYSTHKLRHTAATLMYQTGEVDIRVLKDILGHEQLTTTQIYTHVSDRGMEEAVAKNPLSDVYIPPKTKGLRDGAPDEDGEDDEDE